MLEAENETGDSEQKLGVMVDKALGWDSGDLGLIPSFATDFPCDLGQFLICKLGYDASLSATIVLSI